MNVNCNLHATGTFSASTDRSAFVCAAARAKARTYASLSRSLIRLSDGYNFQLAQNDSHAVAFVKIGTSWAVVITIQFGLDYHSV